MVCVRLSGSLLVRPLSGTKDANEVLVSTTWCAAAGVGRHEAVQPDKLVKFSDLPSELDIAGYPTGWSELDRRLSSIPPLAVSRASGRRKSQFALALCANMARIHRLKFHPAV
jgi:hypothetical protein